MGTPEVSSYSWMVSTIKPLKINPNPLPALLCPSQKTPTPMWANQGTAHVLH